MGRRNWIEWLLLSVAVIAAVATAVAYSFWFRGAPQGGPSEWSEFGEYFSGILNPVIGIVTVILIVLTLRTTRREAADTRHQMEQQIAHLERQALLSDMHKRLDGALSEWNRLLDQQASGEFQATAITYNGGHKLTNRTVRTIVEDGALRSKLIDRKSADKDPASFVAMEWTVFKHDLVPLLAELDRYCLAYERASGTRHLTDFYKARIRQGLRSLRLAGIMPESAAERLSDISSAQ